MTQSPESGDRPVRPDYSKAAAVLSSGDHDAMLQLASDWRAAPEVLFVLSQSASTEIRATVATNRKTPEAANDLLLNDTASDVRSALGRKIARMLPELQEDDANRLRDAATAKLLTLARDVDVAVRRVLATEVCRLGEIPKELAQTLVRDTDALVSTPMAEFSPLLDDDDLIALIGEPPSPATLAAVARRDGLASCVSDRIVETGDHTLIGTLLRNTTAQIREDTLNRLVDEAPQVEMWHEPLVNRTELTDALVAKLSEFVASSLVQALASRHDLAPDLAEKLKRKVIKGAKASDSFGEATEQQIADAARRGSESGVITALTLRLDAPARAIRRIFASRTPKAILAMAWKAGLSAETAALLQSFPGRIPESRRLAPADDGSYPLSRDELAWHAERFVSGRKN